jgi:hypothetical protein
MRRSSRWRRGRRSDSRTTANDTEQRHTTPASTHLIAVADGGQRLSDGLLVEASVVARLLRVRLLVINASLIVAPAHVKGRPRPAVRAGGAAPITHPARARAIAAGLAAAEQYLSEGSASLARSRR